MESEYARIYRRIYEHHWWFRARERFLIERISELAPAEGFGDILDVGCGDGLFFDVLRRWGRPQGVEPDADIVSPELRENGTVHCTGFDSEFDPGTRFGLITMLDVVEHLEDDQAALRRAGELLVDGGKVVVTVPAFSLLWTTHDVINHHYRRYTRPQLVAVARAAGLEVRHSAYFFGWLTAIKLAQRLAETVRKPKSALPTLPSDGLNRLFFHVSRLEQRFHSAWFPPFGSSLLLVAERVP